MQITLNQDEIELAITNYVRGQITIADNTQISVELRAGRGENGFTASLDIRSIVNGVPAAKPVTRTAEAPTDEPVAASVTTLPPATRKKAEPAQPAPLAPVAATGLFTPKKVEEPAASIEDGAVPDVPEVADAEPVAEPAAAGGGIFSFGVKN